MIRPMGKVVSLLDRPTYAPAQVDQILGLTPGTAWRWIDGYTRSGRPYSPVIRESPTGEQEVTWGEFVEARFLAEYRTAGVPIIHMRPVVDQLRKILKTKYPLASSALWLNPSGRELARTVQREVDLDRRLALVMLRTNQETFADDELSQLGWTQRAKSFVDSVEWSEDQKIPARIYPMANNEDVTVDPERGFGEPVVRGVRTEVIAELVRAGDTPEMIAELYELPLATVNSAVRYELSRLRSA